MSERVASVIAIVDAPRCLASFIARTTIGCARPAEKAITSESSSTRDSRVIESWRGLATTSARMSSSASRWRR